MNDKSNGASVLHRCAAEHDRAGQTEAAFSCICRALALSPDDAGIASDFLTLSRRRDPGPPRYDWVVRVLILNPVHVTALRMFAIRALNRQSWRQAAKYWSKVVVLNPGLFQDYRPLAEASLRVRDLEWVLRLLEKAVRGAPESVDLRFMLATLLFNASRFDASQVMLMSLIEKGISDPKLQFWMGRVLRAQGRHVEAELHLSKAAESGPELARSVNMVRATVCDKAFS